ncbi:DUF2249 domain-containing protein [Thiobacillus sp.]|uniref:DUF2249 domain-containing protein n=1 Tax=Thiobacillus sp. TaxID=924 RepID=UPI0025CD12BB|nr:DUF2249 domain-containing protein [Thiobacillus sp.]
MIEPADEILVDARELEPPEPMEKVLRTLALLRPGQSIRLLLHREPFPLYPCLPSAATATPRGWKPMAATSS